MEFLPSRTNCTKDSLKPHRTLLTIPLQKYQLRSPLEQATIHLETEMAMSGRGVPNGTLFLNIMCDTKKFANSWFYRHMWADKPTQCWNNTGSHLFSKTTKFWVCGHVTEHRDESISNLDTLNELNNQKVYM